MGTLLVGETNASFNNQSGDQRKILKKKFTTLRNIKNVHSLLFPRESVTLNAIHLSE